MDFINLMKVILKHKISLKLSSNKKNFLMLLIN